MLKIRFADKRGVTRLSWLDSRHSFSFGDYYEPDHMGFHTLRVINQDIVKPGAGFAMHPHKNMEIITYVLKGAVIHQDSLGNETIIRPGEVQRMSAGSGVKHSEYNHSKNERVELLQIWLLPAQKNLAPGYQQIAFDLTQTGLQILATAEDTAGTLLIHQRAKLLRGYLQAGQILDLPVSNNNSCWLQMISGQLLLNDQLINSGDGVAIEDERSLKIKANETSEFLLFEL